MKQDWISSVMIAAVPGTTSAGCLLVAAAAVGIGEGGALEILRYEIRTNAVEKLVPLSKNEPWCSKKAEYWLDGKKVGERRWWKNGQLSDEHPMRDGLLHGVSRWWRDDGKRLLSEHPYQNGQLHGVSKAWDSNGRLVSEISCKAGMKDGLDKNWNSKGKPVWELPYRADKLHGIGKYWKENAEFQAPSLLLKIPGRVTFWIDGNEVPKKMYIEGCRTNASLPRLPDAK